MTILVTGTSGQLGRLVIDALLARGVEPSALRAGARRLDAIADLAELGVQTVELDYLVPDTVDAAVAGVESVLLVSGSEVGARLHGHLNVIEAAKAAGVGKFVYTSITHAATGDFVLVPEHRATEEAIAASGVPSVILRNNWYHENYALDVQRAADSGVIASAVGSGRVASASRADYAEAAAIVLVQDGHLGEVYELGGESSWALDELAAAASEVLGREVHVLDLTPDQLRSGLTDAGLDEGTADFVVALQAGIADGFLDNPDPTLSRLLGRRTTPLVDALRAAVGR